MKLEQLNYFIEVAKQQHLSRAARILGVSPSTLSHSISGLERELGRELFSKKGKNIFLTTHGKLLAERAQEILKSVERVRDDLSSDRLDLEGHYKIAGTHALLSAHVAPAWNAVRDGSRAAAEIHSLRSAEVLAKVAAAEIDLGFCLNPQFHPRVSSRIVGVSRTFVVVRAGHPLLRKQPETRLLDLAPYPFAGAIELPGVEPCRAHPIFSSMPKTLRPTYRYDSYDVAESLLASSEAWGIFPEILLGGKRCPLRILSTRLHGMVNVTALWPVPRDPSPALRLLMRRMEERLSPR